MRILLGNQTLALLAGSETWIKTLASYLHGQGHEVVCYSPHLGIIAEGLESSGIQCIGVIPSQGIQPFSIVLEPEFDKRFDLIIANHHDVVSHLRDAFPEIFIVSTIHGVLHKMTGPNGAEIPAPEHPAVGKADQFIAVSEEVQAKLMTDYGVSSVVVRNFFDLGALKASRPISAGKPKRILFNTNYATKDDKETQIVRDVAHHFGAQLIAVGENFAPARDISRALEDADIVVGMGRSVLEGVAAGRIGIVHGRWGTGGLVHAGSVNQLRACNFSGRNSGGDFMTVERMIEEIECHYCQETVDWGLEYMKANHNVASAASAYLAYAKVDREAAPAEPEVRKARFQSGNFSPKP